MTSTKNNTDIESVLKTLSLAANRQPSDIQKLIELAGRNLAILEPWNHARSDHPDAMRLISAVQDLSASFVKAMKHSREVAQRGFKVSEDMIHMCNYLADKHIRSAEIERFVNDMIPQTKTMTKETKKMVTKFCSVRTELILITNEIPGQVLKIQEEHKEEIRELEVAKKNKEWVNVGKAVGTAFAAVAGGAAAIAFPPALIFLPVAFPVIQLLSDMLDKRMSRSISDRVFRSQSCEEALETLHEMTKDLNQLNICIDEFASFWTHAETLLGVVTARIKELRNTKAPELRLKTVRSSWTNIKDSYESYAAKVELLCQFATPPPPRPALPPSDARNDKGDEKAKDKSEGHNKASRNVLKKPH